MKLELKHIAPYLPYDLECECPLLTEDREGSKVCDIVGAFSDWVAISTKDSNIHDEFEYDEFNPLLRPIEDIVSEIEHNGETFIPFEELDDTSIYSSNYKNGKHYARGHVHGVSSTTIDDLNKLLEWHFDIFGLIEKGLAIKKQTK